VTKTTGAQNDIVLASALARDMVTRWGMSDRLGMVQLAPRENPFLASVDEFPAGRPYSETTAAAVDAEVHRIISESRDEALRLLRQHRRELDALAAALLDRETVDEQDILAVTGLPAAPALNMEKLSSSGPQ
jgi:cell division protease FtsH